MTDPVVSLKVEIAFGDGPFAASPTWTDVSDKLVSDGGPRGRTFELDQVQTGTRTIVLDNSDGRFTPGRLTSEAPYLGNIKLRRQVRVSVVVNGTAYRRFTGYTGNWDAQAPNGGEYATCTLTVVDGFDYFSRLPLTTPYREEVLRDDPLMYWPMTADGGGDITFGGAVGSLSKHQELPMYLGAHQGTIAPADYDPASLVGAGPAVVQGDGSYQALLFKGGSNDGAYVATQNANLLGFAYEPYAGISNTPDYTFEMWLTFPKAFTVGEVYFAQLNQARSAPAFAIMADGLTGETISIRWYTADDGSTWEEVDLNNAVIRNPKGPEDIGYVAQPHHVVVSHTGLTRASWGVQKVYLDGSLIATKDLTGYRAVSASIHYVGGVVYGELGE